LEQIQAIISYISQNQSREGVKKVRSIYVEGWVLRELSKIPNFQQTVQLTAGDTPNKSVDVIRLKVFDPEKFIEMNEKSKHGNLDIITPETETSLDNSKAFQNFDYVLCLGGDGTLLRLLRIFYFHTRPLILPKIVTISMGSLCYLANFKVTEIKDVLEATVLHRQKEELSPVKVDYRFRLTCNVQDVQGRPVSQKRIFLNNDGEQEVQPAACQALNEISISRGSAEFMCRFDIYINEVFLTTVQGDGILISTPTGSTAYNLSCGGSIVHDTSDVVCLTPISAHSLSFRPIILPKSVTIRVVLPQDARTGAWVTFDGQMRFKIEKEE
jgi:NAD kinase